MIFDLYENLTLLMLILLTFLLTFYVSKKVGVSLIKSVVLFFYHSFFVFVYTYVVSIKGGDATEYYRWAGELDYNFLWMGTPFIVNISKFCIDVLHLSFYGTSYFFAYFGFVGLLFFDKSLEIASQKTSSKIGFVAKYLIFLPSINFWTASLGKDSMVFFAMSIIIYNVLIAKISKKQVLISIYILFMARPHICFVLLGAFLISAFFSRINLSKKFILVLVSVISLYLLFPLIQNYTKLDSLGDLGSYVEQRQNYNLQGTSVDLTSMNYFSQVFTYLFRPLPIEANSFNSFISSIDNFILLLFTIVLLFQIKLKNNKYRKVYNTNFLLFYSVIALTMLATTTANLGIAVRQKWMVLPVILILLLLFNRQNNRKANFKKYRLNNV